MTIYIVIAVCVALLIFLGALFAYEDTRERRLVAPVRNGLDRLCDFVASIFSRVHRRFLNGVIRLALLYVMHTLLGAMRRSLAGGMEVISRLQRRNKQMARTISKKRSNTKLTEIVEDRKNNALSDNDKEALKSRSLEGK